MSERFNIEDLVREEFANREIRPSKDLFAKIDASYKKKKRRRFGFFFFCIALLSLSALLLRNTNDSRSAEVLNSEKNTVSSVVQNEETSAKAQSQNIVSESAQSTVNQKKFENKSSSGVSLANNVIPSKLKENKVHKETSYSNASSVRRDDFAFEPMTQNSDEVNEEKSSENAQEVVAIEKENEANDTNTAQIASAVLNVKLNDTLVITNDEESKKPLPDSILQLVSQEVKENTVSNDSANSASKLMSAFDARKIHFFIGGASNILMGKVLNDQHASYSQNSSYSFFAGLEKSFFKHKLLVNVGAEYSYLEHVLYNPTYVTTVTPYSGISVPSYTVYARKDYFEQSVLSIPVALDYKLFNFNKYHVNIGGGAKFNFSKYKIFDEYLEGPSASKGKFEIKGLDTIMFKKYYPTLFAEVELARVMKYGKIAVFSSVNQNIQFTKADSPWMQISFINLQLGVKYTY